MGAPDQPQPLTGEALTGKVGMRSAMTLTAMQARTLRFMLSQPDGLTRCPDRISVEIRAMLATEFAAVHVTSIGLNALAEYERSAPDRAIRERIAAGMSSAGRTTSNPGSSNAR